MKNFIFLLLLSSLLISRAQDSTSKVDAALIDVTVTDFDGQTKAGETIIFEGVDSKKLIEGISDDMGKLQVSLLGGDTYLIKIKGIGESTDYNKITIPALPPGQTHAKNILAIQFESPKLFTLNNIYFDSGKSTLKESSKKELQDLLDYMTLKKDLEIEISGHTDNVGEETDNLTLSENRAKAVKSYLIKNRNLSFSNQDKRIWRIKSSYNK